MQLFADIARYRSRYMSLSVLQHLHYALGIHIKGNLKVEIVSVRGLSLIAGNFIWHGTS